MNAISGDVCVTSQIRRMAALALSAILLLGGCAAMERAETKNMERLLAAAGFQMQFAKTPEQMAKVTALPQNRLIRTNGPDGQTRFVWADATDCQCLFVGTEAAYDRYRKLGVEQQIAAENEMAAMDWDSWGWGPWW